MQIMKKVRPQSGTQLKSMIPFTLVLTRTCSCAPVGEMMEVGAVACGLGRNGRKNVGREADVVEKLPEGRGVGWQPASWAVLRSRPSDPYVPRPPVPCSSPSDWKRRTRPCHAKTHSCPHRQGPRCSKAVVCLGLV